MSFLKPKMLINKQRRQTCKTTNVFTQIRSKGRNRIWLSKGAQFHSKEIHDLHTHIIKCTLWVISEPQKNENITSAPKVVLKLSGRNKKK